ncbi:rho guanine nucleotide exchange factor 12-like isoform X2 [Cottoperca gobio]|uniref:Rho guanine nucleotide exchange factor 12-like isoform X2 n=1 Tax=Cottoperca gobio TaxID=56716 RepID=A0A6J2P9B3_COTGO|nr:rho guanine nucleotide exchange factor 12-like isoform X2 [Cottoperca gobio]XP_029282628.1 rho guanine nucleotide exchange factor 12-like isoform X2 [Cottoperca gobio]
MSGTQSTLTDRTPSILNKEPADKKPKNDKSSVSLKQEFDPTGLVQRCVIIQRDENGFGLTVSGDNPVFVQLVKEDGAAMRAGVQTGDRIIKVNGTLVTHSNHIEVVKLIKSGSYVALTVLGRPPGLPNLSLGEDEKEEGAEVSPPSAPSAPRSPALPGGEHIPSSMPEGGENKTTHSQKADLLQKMLTKEQQDLQAKEEEYSRNPRPKLLKEVQEVKKHVSLLQERLSKAALQDGAAASRNGEAEGGHGGPPLREHTPSSRADSRTDGPPTNNNSTHSSPPTEGPGKRETPCQSPDISRRDGLNFCDTDDTPDTDSRAQCIVGNPPYLPHLQIIGAEDDYFDSQQEQINGLCSCFQSVDSLKCRPAHLAVFLHHVVSQFDPVPLLCYLYADMHKQTSSKESRRFFMEFHSLFMDRTANLKVPVPDAVAAELEKRRLELIPEELCKQYTQLLQDTLLPDLHKNLEDFRQKRSMGLTLAEDELCKLDSEGGKDQQALEKECSCAEHILSKIEDVLLTTQNTEEEKCQTMQYVILTYMKHLGVKVKEPRGLEHKRARINFLPKIKKSMKPEKEAEEKVKKPRFHNILGPPRRLSRVDSTSVGKAVEMNKQRSPKPLSQPASVIPEQSDSSASNSGRTRGNQLGEGSDAGAQSSPSTTSPTLSSPTGQASDTSGQDSDCNVSPLCVQPRAGEALQPGDHQDAVSSPTSTQFDFSPSNLEQLQEEEQDNCRMEVQSSADIQSEDDQGGEMECEENPLNWQSLVSRGVLATLTPQEIKRQEVINELFYTERAHLRMLKVLDCVFHQRLNRDGILPPEDIKHIFINLEEIIQLHVSVTEQMTAIRKRSETSAIGPIADDLLAWFSGEEEEKIKRAVGTFCSNQPSALELIKSRQKKDQRFTLFMQDAESNRLCRRLQLKDIIPVEMQRVTKYPLLLDNIAKYTGDGEEREKVKKAGECCKKILNHVNQAVKEAENKQRLEEYQRRLDLSSLKQSENPMILELRNLDLTKRKMVHEGPLSWKVNKDKTIELYTILLEDILVLLQKQDERLVLKFHGKNPASAADAKHIFSPIIKLNTVLVRPVATENKSFFVLSMSENGAQIYELMAQTVFDQRAWQCLITQCADAMKAKPHNRDDTPAAQSEAERDAIEIIKRGMPKASKDANGASSGNILSSDKDAASSPDIQAAPSMNPFDGMKSEDEEEELTVADGREEEEEDEEEVDEAELEAFLDGHLADGLPFLQDESHQGVAAENQEPNAFGVPSSKGEDALRTLAMLKQALFNHMVSREADEEKEESEQLSASLPGSPEGPADSRASLGSQRENLQLPSAHTELSETPERNGDGGFVVLDFGGGPEESSTDDDGGVGGDVGIDMRKLLSSSSQAAGGGGPDLSRQLMTHMRLLQADLQYLKEVEVKYNELRQTHSDAAADSDENIAVFH